MRSSQVTKEKFGRRSIATSSLPSRAAAVFINDYFSPAVVEEELSGLWVAQTLTLGQFLAGLGWQ